DLAPVGLGLLNTTGFTMANATFAGSFLLLGLLFNILWFIKEKRWIYGISALLIFFTPFILLNGLWRVGSIWSPGLFIGDARASSATAILVVIYILGLYLLRRFVNVRKATFVYSTIWIVLFSLAVAMLFVPGSFIRNKYIEQASAARVLVWDIGFEAFKDKPLLGWGPENFRFGFYKHFNPELMLRQNLNEVWFDRAHNVFIDTLVNVGAIGFIIFFILFAYAIFILYKVYKKGKIGFWEAEIIGVLLFAHVLQIQTSFNTITTYIILSFVLGYLLWLENGDSQIVDKKKVVAIVLVIFSLSSLYLNSREFTTQRSLIKLFTSSTNEEQVINIKKVSAKTHDFELIRISSASFISGFLTQLYKNGNQTVFDNGIGQIHLYEEWYKKYLKNIPNDYRANINYSYLLLTKSALGEDSIEEAKSLISRTYSLSPNNPTTYAIGAIAELYDGNLEKTLEIWSEGKNLNPKSPYVEKMGAYLLEQVNNFPDIDIARVENI
ncbi:MAG: O-antigen ligase family protein, partial [Candidatus Pacebacteria bacterium]|nr:O-antigen ligase family protein [Candidatus Paceibacterota bacterium]